MVEAGYAMLWCHSSHLASPRHALIYLRGRTRPRQDLALHPRMESAVVKVMTTSQDAVLVRGPHDAGNSFEMQRFLPFRGVVKDIIASDDIAAGLA